jgi:hypothetical protein
MTYSRTIVTAARWPEKIEGRKIAEVRQKWQKRDRKIFLPLFRGETLLFFVFSYILYFLGN